MKTEEIAHFQRRLQNWYQTHRRPLPWRRTKDPYCIWVSEVMLQQTRVNTVIPYYQRFIKQFPDVSSLAQAKLQAVLKCWEGLGYYTRARNLHRAAGRVVAHHEQQVPADWDAFIALPGVGPYIAAAVLSIAFDLPFAVVDGNVKRILARVFEESTQVNAPKAQRIFLQLAEPLIDRTYPGRYNQAFMELGAMVCTPRRPNCQDCPVRTHCLGQRRGTVDLYPKRHKRRAIPQVAIAVGVIRRDGLVLLTRRKPDGLLGGLWEFPGGKINANESAVRACRREIEEEVGLKISVDRHLTQIRHAYTHFKIVMDVFLCDYIDGDVQLNGPADYRWIDIDDIDAYPLPKANHKFLGKLRAAGRSAS